jgi:hypothetical protein
MTVWENKTGSHCFNNIILCVCLSEFDIKLKLKLKLKLELKLKLKVPPGNNPTAVNKYYCIIIKCTLKTIQTRKTTG